ncbi:hypothetical protein Cgig2_014458 [Carnegiea gigantea]|uniref:Uncharacterized protein n=1 Tax=Carnegiea gigantea TaxID=171969 RepID=A0A9Q1K9Z3_9CARY|nr:hypothetical protein Cgig2_014458 [Carnegiea gigantea]
MVAAGFTIRHCCPPATRWRLPCLRLWPAVFVPADSLCAGKSVAGEATGVSLESRQRTVLDSLLRGQPCGGVGLVVFNSSEPFPLGYAVFLRLHHNVYMISISRQGPSFLRIFRDAEAILMCVRQKFEVLSFTCRLRFQPHGLKMVANEIKVGS